jgi:nicotinamidase-related amidase
MAERELTWPLCDHTSGVATDVAVLNTVLDAVQLFPPHSVYIIKDALRGFVPSLTEQALNAMKQSGAQFVSVAALKK